MKLNVDLTLDRTIIYNCNHPSSLTQLPPLIPPLYDQSARILGDAARSFRDNCAIGIEPNMPVIEKNLHGSLMLVTALNRHIGYDNASKVAKKAFHDNTTLKEAAAALGLVDPAEFDSLVNPAEMISPRAKM